MVVMLVTPSVVLLDNHTTNRKGWKWENKPWNEIQGYYANYFKLNNYDMRTELFYFLYGGHVLAGFLYNAGASGSYWSSVIHDLNDAYHLGFNGIGIFPSYSSWRSHGFSIRCLAR